MLHSLLTLLLPCWVTPFELEFHTQFVLRTYKDYYEHLAATGLRDRKVLSEVKKKTAYSMSMILWRKPLVWLRIRRFHNRLLRLKKSVLPLEDVPKLLSDFA